MLFLLQQGHAMMDLDRAFIMDHEHTGVILGPRTYTRDQIERHVREIVDIGAELLFDPQFYLPRTSIENILNYPYWNGVSFETTDFISTQASDFCRRVINYQVEVLSVSKLILPGRYTNSGDSYWRDLQATFAETASNLDIERPIYSTISIGPDVVLSQDIFDTVIDEALSYDVDGYYILTRLPQDRFLVEDDIYLYALLDAFLSLAGAGKDIILGYANQQSLVYAGAGVSTIASGNFRRMRHYNPEIFDIQEDEFQQRRPWYYDPNSLGEYRLQSIGLAFRRGLERFFAPPCEHCRPFLRTPNRTELMGERECFRHFLHELHRQWLAFSAMQRADRAAAVRNFLTTVDERINELRTENFHLGDRGFDRAIDPTVSALESFTTDRADDIRSL